MEWTEEFRKFNDNQIENEEKKVGAVKGNAWNSAEYFGLRWLDAQVSECLVESNSNLWFCSGSLEISSQRDELDFLFCFIFFNFPLTKPGFK